MEAKKNIRRLFACNFLSCSAGCISIIDNFKSLVNSASNIKIKNMAVPTIERPMQSILNQHEVGGLREKDRNYF